MNDSNIRRVAPNHGLAIRCLTNSANAPYSFWQEGKDSNPDRTVLETGMLPLHHQPVLPDSPSRGALIGSAAFIIPSCYLHPSPRWDRSLRYKAGIKANSSVLCRFPGVRSQYSRCSGSRLCFVSSNNRSASTASRRVDLRKEVLRCKHCSTATWWRLMKDSNFRHHG